MVGGRRRAAAHNVAAAGEAAKALAYARRAGERAMDMHAYEEAAAQYRWALEALKFAGSDEAVRCELLLCLGAAQARAGRYREAEESCLEAAELRGPRATSLNTGVAMRRRGGRCSSTPHASRGGAAAPRPGPGRRS